MKRTLWSLVFVGLVAGFVGSVRLLEAQTPSSGGAFVPNTIIRIAGVWLNNKLLYSNQAPTQIASGFGTSPSISSSNGNKTFRVTVGTGSSDTSGVVTMPTATTGWNCVVTDSGPPVGFAFITKVTASTATSITMTAYDDTGAVKAWNAGTVLVVSCDAY